MSTRSLPIRGLAAAIALATLAAACVDQQGTGPTGPNGNLAPATATDTAISTVDGDEFVPEPAPDAIRGHEEEFVKLAQEIPGFAGYFYDGGTRVVQLTDLSQQARAAAALDASATAKAELAEGSAHAEGQKTGATRYVQARYDFLTLRGFRDRSSQNVLSVDGAEFADLDEARNRIVVGISSETAQAGVEQQLKEAGVPLEAVEYEITKPVEPHVTLQQFRRPLEGGLQIAWSSYVCTLGFITVRSGQRAFVTNSHCSNTTWALDGVSYYQPWVAAANLVGREVADPRSWRCGPFWSRRDCRWSDAAIAQISSGTVASNLGFIARTRWWGGPNFGAVGSLDIDDPTRPRMRITGKRAFPRRGDMVDKVGRTSGWTYGFVTRTCVDSNVGGRRVLCQDYATYTSQGGDSGSPVFVWHGDTVTLQGINWGSNGSEAVFSSMWNIEADLGWLQVW